MDDRQKRHVKNELRQVLQLNSQIQFDNLSEVQTIYERVSSGDYNLTTPFGQRYVKELGKLLENTGEKAKCAICQKECDNESLICNRCKDKYIKKKPGQEPAVEAVPELEKTEEKMNPATEAMIEQMRAQTLQSANSDVEKIKKLGKPDISGEMKELRHRCIWKYKEALVFVVLYIAMGVVYYLKPNNSFMPMLVCFGSAALSVLMMFYFYEADPLHRSNASQTVMQIFFGGAAYTLMAFLIKPTTGRQVTNLQAFCYGAIAELLKLLLIAFALLLRRRRVLILEAVFMGASIGAGFAVFEAVGYIFGRMVRVGYDDLLNAIFHRVVFLSGSEIAWAAYTAAALVWACKKKPFRMYQMFFPNFLLYFLLPLSMHALWDMPFGRWMLGPFSLKQVLLFLLIMIMLQEFVRRGMVEYHRYKEEQEAQ
ncbi:MAG: PrsW family intramembrane metalloprotease [Lachnospiraceae bacterium]|nr:PrsW family intramembrane metalloprotease [Lachnospiraceae bacterium]